MHTGYADANAAVKNPHYRPDVDGLRAIAVLLVVGYHAFPETFRGGFVGVDIFFVISGYLITGILVREADNGALSIARFYARRIRRIFPALILVATSALATGWFLLSPNDFRSLGASVSGGAFFVQNLVLMNEVGYFDIEAVKKPLLHLWSLGIEEQFYICWPIVILALARLKIEPISTTFALACGSFLFGVLAMRVSQDLAFYFPVGRVWELFLGAMLAIAAVRKKELCLRSPPSRHRALVLRKLNWLHSESRGRTILHESFAIAGVALICYCVADFDARMQYPGFLALAPVASAVLLVASRDTWTNRRVLSNRALVLVGLISYPLYLWHYPLMAFMRISFVDGVPFAVMIACILVSFLLAWLTYFFVEQPIRFSNGVAHRVISVQWLLVAMTLLGLGGMATWATNGFSGREPTHLKRYMLTGKETRVHWRSGSCFLEPEDDAGKVGRECAGGGRHPMILIWGDSYAAALYPGLKEVASSHGYVVAQYTAAACPPLPGFTTPRRPQCGDINDAVIRKVKELQPEIMLLHSTWKVGAADLEKGLSKAIRELGREGKTRIVIVGPVPEWKGNGLAANVLDYYFGEGAFALLPARTKYRLVENDADATMRKLATSMQVEYFSPRDALCNKDGCLARIGKDAAELTAFDYGHLTVAGSVYIARSLWHALR